MSCFQRKILILIISVFLTCSFLPTHALSSGYIPVDSPEATITSSGDFKGVARDLAPYSGVTNISFLTIVEDTQWSGILRVDGVITVAPQATLTILPGTTIRFNADSGILVLGRIVVKGTESEPVSMLSIFLSQMPSDWYGIVLTATSKKNSIDHLLIKGAANALNIRSSNVDITNTQIYDCISAIKTTDSISRISGIKISGCEQGIISYAGETDLYSVTIEKSETAISVSESSLTAEKLKIASSLKTGLFADKAHLKLDKSIFSANNNAVVIRASDGIIQRSRFISNTETALSFAQSPLRVTANQIVDNRVGIQLDDAFSSIWGNSIYGNNSYNLLYLGNERMYIGGNWFGATVSTEVKKSVYSKSTGLIDLFPLMPLEPSFDFQ